MAHVATCALLLAMLLGNAPANAVETQAARPSPLQDLRARLADAEAQLADLEVNETTLESAAVAAREAVVAADKQAAAAADREAVAFASRDRARQRAAAAADDLADAEQDLAEAEATLAETDAELARLRHVLRTRARAAYMHGGSLGVVEMLLNIEDYDDIAQVERLLDEVIEHDDVVVTRWLEFQSLRRDQLADAAAEATVVASAQAAAEAAAIAAEDALQAAVAATAEAIDEQRNRDRVLADSEEALAGLSDERVHVEATIEALSSSIVAEESAARFRREEADRLARDRAAREAAARRVAEEPEPVDEPEQLATSTPREDPVVADPVVDDPVAPDPDDDVVVPDDPPPPSGGSTLLCGSDSGWAWPTAGCVDLATGAGYGPRSAPTEGASSFHRGLDIAAPLGQPIRATAAGRVWRSNYSPSHGYVVVVDHGGGLYTLYAHQRRQAPVSVGEWVEAGQVIGEIGSTGISTGAHLHLEVHVGCVYSCSRVNPAPYFS